MKKKIALCLALCIAMLGSGNIVSQAHDEHVEHSELFQTVVVKDGTDLDVVKCVALAFRNSPKIKRKKYELDVAKSNVGIAKSAFFPVIGAGVGYYNENNYNKNRINHYYRELPNVGVAVNQLVWDFGKSIANIKMEEFYKIGAEYEFMDSLCMTLFDVKEKYYEVLRAQALVDVAEDNVKICRKYLKMAKGTPDKTTAQVQLSKASFELCYAKTVLKNAKVDLSNAMFIDNTPAYNILNTETFNYKHDFGYEKQYIPSEFVPHNFDIPVENRLEIAYASSPDLRVLESTRDAMEQALKFVKRKYLPELSANVGYGYNNSTEMSNNSLAVGVNLSTEINLMDLKHSIKGADAQLNLADNEIALFKKDLSYEVQRAFNNLDFAAEDVPYAQATAKQALENINVVEKLYKDGSLNYVALQDARKDYITAMQNYIKSLHFYNQSLIQVEEALHYHLVDIHHKSQHAVLKHSDELIEHLNEALGCNEKEPKVKKRRKGKDNL
ncbi:TolC family protein [bacterium]|nr:TolC family protein [bacterium]